LSDIWKLREIRAQERNTGRSATDRKKRRIWPAERKIVCHLYDIY